MYKICFYVPDSHLEEVKNALFASGAGKIGEYSHCAWQVLGTGQFLPLENSNAFVGEPGKMEHVSEYRVEMVCADAYIHATVQALKATHPYETPAYHVWRIEDL